MASRSSSSSSSSSNSGRLPRTSIHTPLKPANVQDLKAKFDPSKAGGGGGADSTLTTATSAARMKSSNSPLIERKTAQGLASGKDVSSLSSSSSSGLKSSASSSAGVSLTSLSSSLQAAAQRKQNSSVPSTTSSSSSSNAWSTSKSSIALTTARPFSPPSSSSSKPGSATSSGKSSPLLDNNVKTTTTTSSFLLSSSATSTAKKWEPKSVTKTTWSSNTSSNYRTGSSTAGDFTASDFRSSFERDKDGRLELPVMHITASGSEVKVEAKAPRGSSSLDNKLGSNEKRTEKGSRYLGKKVSDTKTVFDSGSVTTSKPNVKTEHSVPKEESPPVQRSNRLIAREITIERLDSGVNVTSYKDTSQSKATTKTTTTTTAATGKKDEGTTNVAGPGKKIKEIKVEQVTSSQTASSDDSSKPEFAQVKLRKAKQNPEEKSSLSAKPTGADLDDKRLSRKMSSERFERLMFDFQRGVPTENIARRPSETDHIALQQKARELLKTAEQEEVPLIAKRKKEESIFSEGLKVSDFVKQVNKMNPEVDAPPKWKVQRVRSQTSSTASSDVGGDNSYQGIPGEDSANLTEEDDDDDIYEKVTHRTIPANEGAQDGDSAKTPGRRLGVYRKQKGGKKKDGQKITKSDTLSDSEEIVIRSDGEGGWEGSEGTSSGTEYEDVGQEEEEQYGGDEGGECLYEDLETFAKPATGVKNKTLGHKLKKIFYNKKGAKNKKGKVLVDSGVSAGTDSDIETQDDPDEVDNDVTETLSRTSSERSSGRLTRDDNTLSSISTAASAATTASNTEETLSSAAAIAANLSQAPMSSSNMPPPPPPPLPPRTSKALIQLPENSPPLPPRNPALSNKATLGIPLDTVVPVSPTSNRRSGNYDKKKDRFSYNMDGADSGYSTQKLEYIDFDPASPHTLERIERTERKSAASSRPSSTASVLSTASSYIYPDISAFPELKGDKHDDNLYVDLEDEHIYGKTSDLYQSRFESEPLYQWYSKDKMIQNIRADKSTSDDFSDEEYLEVDEERHAESVYEDVERLLAKTNIGTNISSSATTAPTTTVAQSKPEENNKETTEKLSISAKDKPQRRSVIEDVFKNGGTLHRALWCQMPEVKESGLLEKLSDQEKKIQEAMFEIMTSEASYLKSLKVLISVFLMAPEFSADMSDRCVITRRDRQILFSNIGNIKDISEEFLKDLEARWQESCYMKDVCDIIEKHAANKFEPYVRYCSNQSFQDRALNTLKQNPEFNEAVKRLEQHPDCQFLPLASFLLLPMQRITRLPLLVDAICHRLEPGTPKHASAKKALDKLTRVAKRCDEAAKKMQQTEQICLLAKSLEFKIKEFPIVSSSRFLVKQGELTLIKSEGTTRKPLSKLLGSNKEHMYLFLFNDILLVAKKKGANYQVRDYCQRNSLHVEAIDNPDKSRHIAPGAATAIPNILFLAMLANHENKQVELVLSCKSESERTRWIDAIMPTHSASENERIYDQWDCPQFQCVRKYIAQQPDELNLEESDVINVTRKMADGWCEGERIRDGEKGWFPASHTEEINNSHVRARNLRLRYRLLIASQDYAQTEFIRH